MKSIDERLANLRAQLEQAKANSYGLQGAIQALEELKADHLAGASPALTAPYGTVE